MVQSAQSLKNASQYSNWLPLCFLYATFLEPLCEIEQSLPAKRTYQQGNRTKADRAQIY